MNGKNNPKNNIYLPSLCIFLAVAVMFFRENPFWGRKDNHRVRNNRGEKLNKMSAYCRIKNLREKIINKKQK